MMMESALSGILSFTACLVLISYKLIKNKYKYIYIYIDEERDDARALTFSFVL